MLASISKLQCRNLDRPLFVCLFRRAPKSFSPDGEVVPEIFRLRLFKELHEIPPCMPARKHSCVLIYVSDENCDIIADPPFNLHIRRPYTFITPALQCGRRAAENFSGFPGIDQAWHPFLEIGIHGSVQCVIVRACDLTAALRNAPLAVPHSASEKAHHVRRWRPP